VNTTCRAVFAGNADLASALRLEVSYSSIRGIEYRSWFKERTILRCSGGSCNKADVHVGQDGQKSVVGTFELGFTATYHKFRSTCTRHICKDGSILVRKRGCLLESSGRSCFSTILSGCVPASPGSFVSLLYTTLFAIQHLAVLFDNLFHMSCRHEAVSIPIRLG
jgi:hypothetical protein